jgi:hypothetical protein
MWTHLQVKKEADMILLMGEREEIRAGYCILYRPDNKDKLLG